MKKKIVIIGVLLVVFAALLFAVNRHAVQKKEAELALLASTPHVASRLPLFTLMDSISQSTVATEAIVGEKFLLNVWATWCVACKQEHEFLKQLQQQNIKIIGLNYLDKAELIEPWFAQHGNPYAVNMLDIDGSVGQMLPVIGAPETYIVNAQGEIIAKHTGILTQEIWLHTLQPIFEKL